MTVVVYFGFGIRITSAEQDKLVGEIDVDQRHLNRGGVVHGGALLAFAGDLGGTVAGLNILKLSDNDDRVEEQHLPRVPARPANRDCRAPTCRTAHGRCADLDLSIRRQACRDDDADPVGAPARAGGTGRVSERFDGRKPLQCI
jgi:hypothetical protein